MEGSPLVLSECLHRQRPRGERAAAQPAAIQRRRGGARLRLRAEAHHSQHVRRNQRRGGRHEHPLDRPVRRAQLPRTRARGGGVQVVEQQQPPHLHPAAGGGGVAAALRTAAAAQRAACVS
jgi:hypothetical protein